MHYLGERIRRLIWNLLRENENRSNQAAQELKTQFYHERGPAIGDISE